MLLRWLWAAGLTACASGQGLFDDLFKPQPTPAPSGDFLGDLFKPKPTPAKPAGNDLLGDIFKPPPSPPPSRGGKPTEKPKDIFE